MSTVLGALVAWPSNALPQTAPNAPTTAWMQSVLDRWQSIATRHLRIDPQPLAWIIFYDATGAWHVNADTTQLPRPHTTAGTLRFVNRTYLVRRVEHSDGALWVPDREALPLRPRVVTMLYDNGRKPFIIVPLPALYRQLSSPDQAADLDQLFLGVSMHELTHTRNLVGFARRADSLRARFKLPDDLDDNIIEDRFSNDTAYVPMFEREMGALMQAVFADNAATARTSVHKALAFAKERKGTFFVDDNAGYAELDDLFLVLEGTAMWAQFKSETSTPTASRNSRRILELLFKQTHAWSQREGLALVLLLDRFQPGWQAQFMSNTFPSPFAVLRDAVR